MYSVEVLTYSYASYQCACVSHCKYLVLASACSLVKCSVRCIHILII